MNTSFNWVSSLRLFNIHTNNSIYSKTGVSPNELMFGYKFSIGIDTELGITFKPNELAQITNRNYIKTLQNLKQLKQNIAQKNSEIFRNKKQSKYDRKVRETKTFSLGQYVLIAKKHLSDLFKSHRQPFVSGFLVVYRRNNTYVLYNPKLNKSVRLNSNQIKEYNPRKLYANTFTGWNYPIPTEAYNVNSNDISYEPNLSSVNFDEINNPKTSYFSSIFLINTI